MDFLPLPQLREVQHARLQAMVQRAYDQVALFRERMEERDLTPASLKRVEDIAQLPFTVKTDLRDTYPFGLFASPLQEIVRFHASSGTTGKPIVVAYTQEDVRCLVRWPWCAASPPAACTAGDIIQNAYGYGLFTGGLGAHYGAEALGATRHPHLGRQHRPPDHGPEGLRGDGHLLHAQLLPAPHRAGRGTGGRPSRTCRCASACSAPNPGPRPCASASRPKAAFEAYDIYGLSEIVGPGVGMECHRQAGPHIFEDMFYPEIINPETGEVLPDGEEGELVLTTLCKRAMPMIRYRTRDITALAAGPCPCGRTLRRICRISRRSDDMLIIRGVNLFPSQIEAALLKVEGTLPHYQIIVDSGEGIGHAGGAGGGDGRVLQRHGGRHGTAAGQHFALHREHHRPARRGPAGGSRTPCNAAKAKPSGFMDKRKM